MNKFHIKNYFNLAAFYRSNCNSSPAYNIDLLMEIKLKNSPKSVCLVKREYDTRSYKRFN